MSAVAIYSEVKSARKGGLRLIRRVRRRKEDQGKKAGFLFGIPEWAVDSRHRSRRSIQDRDGGVFVMATMFGMYPFLMKLYADGGYLGPLFVCRCKNNGAGERGDRQAFRSRKRICRPPSGGSLMYVRRARRRRRLAKDGRFHRKALHFCASPQSESC